MICDGKNNTRSLPLAVLVNIFLFFSFLFSLLASAEKVPLCCTKGKRQPDGGGYGTHTCRTSSLTGVAAADSDHWVQQQQTCAAYLTSSSGKGQEIMNVDSAVGLPSAVSQWPALKRAFNDENVLFVAPLPLSGRLLIE